MARNFGGGNNFITADGAAGFSQKVNYSVAMWVNGPSTNSALTCFYSEGRNSSANPFLLLQQNIGLGANEAVIVCRNDAGGTSQINSVNTGASLNVFDGTWHHFVYAQSVSGTTTTWATYVDGSATVAHGSFTNGTTTINELTVGCARRNTNTQFFGGSVSEVGVWHRTLSAGEIKSLAAGMPASHLGPNHYWPLWGVDSPEPDIGNG